MDKTELSVLVNQSIIKKRAHYSHAADIRYRGIYIKRDIINIRRLFRSVHQSLHIVKN